MSKEERVKRILSELSGEETIDNNATLQGDLALDSLRMVILLIEIEENFGVEVNESDMNPFDLTTVQSVIDIVEKYCGGDEDD